MIEEDDEVFDEIPSYANERRLDEIYSIRTEIDEWNQKYYDRQRRGDIDLLPGIQQRIANLYKELKELIK